MAIYNVQWMTLDNFQWIFFLPHLECHYYRTQEIFWYSYQKAHLVCCANNQSILFENFLCVKEDTPHTLMPHENKYFASIWDFLNHMLGESHITFGNNYIHNLGTIHKIRYWEILFIKVQPSLGVRERGKGGIVIQRNVLFSAVTENTLRMGRPSVQQAC